MSEVPGHEGQAGYGPFQRGDRQSPEAPGATADPAATPGPAHPAPTNPPAAYQIPAQNRPQSGPPATDSWSMFPDGGPGSPSWQPRIVPTPKPSRRRVVVAALVGLLGGLLLFGPTGFVVGYQTAPSPAVAPTEPAPSGTTLPAFERTQLQLNKLKIPRELIPIATSWLPWITSCARSGDPDGPRPGDGEDTRVACHYANTSIFFVRYRSADERDKAYARYLAQNIDAKRLTPGVAGPTTRKTTSGTVNGHYVEYAFMTSADATGKAVCGMWWADATAPIAAYLLAYWTDGLGESWEPMRDVWRRYS